MIETRERVEYTEPVRKRPQKRRRKPIFPIILLMVIAVGVYWGFKKTNSHLSDIAVAQEGVYNQFLSLEEVKAQLTPEMYTREVDEEELSKLSEFENSHSEMVDKIKFLSDNLAAYPSYTVDALFGSPEKIDYIIAYPILKGTTPDNNIVVNTEEGKLPFLLQWDRRWGYAPYGDSIGFCGCAPTCLSMVAIGLTGNTNFTPDVVAQYSYDRGYYYENAGTAWALMTDCTDDFGLIACGCEVDRTTMCNVLDNGGKLICSVLPGDFTATGHFIVINGYNDKGFTVLDPNSVERSNKYWSFSVIEPQIAGMWSYYAA